MCEEKGHTYSYNRATYYIYLHNYAAPFSRIPMLSSTLSLVQVLWVEVVQYLSSEQSVPTNKQT